MLLNAEQTKAIAEAIDTAKDWNTNLPNGLFVRSVTFADSTDEGICQIVYDDDTEQWVVVSL